MQINEQINTPMKQRRNNNFRVEELLPKSNKISTLRCGLLRCICKRWNLLCVMTLAAFVGCFSMTNSAPSTLDIFEFVSFEFNDPYPIFQTSSQDLIAAIDLCINYYALEPMKVPCSIFHLTPNGIYLDFETSKGDFDIGYQEMKSWKKTIRSSYIAGFLKTLDIKMNTTMVFYHRDTIPPQMNGFPIIAHTASSHEDFILFPTPYMLRDLNNGELMKTLKYCSKKTKKLQNRIHDVYFRGNYRNEFRLKVAKYHGEGTRNLPFNVKFTKLPDGSGFNLTKARPSKWTEKMKHEYLLTLRGGYSSQWDVYHDYIAGGLIVRESNDKKEYWNYDLISKHGHNFVNFETIESIADEILASNVQERKQEMADFTFRAACSILRPEKIYAFGQNFLEQYSREFGSIIHGKTYFLSSGRKWTPRLVELPDGYKK